ncbi:MAG TPA: choice-of-anchor B family protein, partial [Phycisphaerales bacterium]|nr:choice-of-anchor B family protein [Phycisphaerales bacterium]
MTRYSHITIALLTGLLSATCLHAQLAYPSPNKATKDKGNIPSAGDLNHRSLPGFDAENVLMHSMLSPGDFGASSGNDCWGYTSPSGREYALMGLNNRMSVVEITNPTNPIIIGTISHSSSTWADIKVYQDVAYVSNESGGGIDVVDLAQVDNGIVTLVQRMTTGGLSRVHNIAIDEVSGFLYLCGGNINNGRLVAYDLSDPRNPSVAGQMSSGPYLHDAQIVTYTTGPNIGRQICFGAAGSSGMYVIDVTNKSNMVTLSQTTYSGLSYCHQCWLHNVRQTLYVNDETDGIALTRVFDVSNLSNPVLTNTFGWGANSIDHNLYVKDDIIYEANYTSGLRILDTTKDPNAPELVGYFDTYPANDGQSYNGLWSCFPFFDSGTVIGSDIQNGLF